MPTAAPLFILSCSPTAMFPVHRHMALLHPDHAPGHARPEPPTPAADRPRHPRPPRQLRPSQADRYRIVVPISTDRTVSNPPRDVLTRYVELF